MKAKNFKARIAPALMALALLVTPLLVVPVGAAGDPTLTVGNASADAGDTISVDVTISGNPGVCCMVLDVEYDEKALLLDDVKTADIGGDIVFDKKIVWLNMGGDTSFNGKFATLVFKVLDGAVIGDENISLSYEDGDICNYDEESVDFAIMDGTISILTGETADPTADTDAQNGSENGSVSGNASSSDSDSGSGHDATAPSGAETSADETEKDAKSSETADRLPVIIAVALVVLVAVGTCVFAVVKNKKSGDSN